MWRIRRPPPRLPRVAQAGPADYEQVIASIREPSASGGWFRPPKRGEYLRRIADALREHKEALGALVSLEMGKIVAEGEGEVQEMIDIADFAVGLSRQLYGLTMARSGPATGCSSNGTRSGTVGVISAFNFPVAVWSWNAMIAAVCGDTVVWKPSSQTPLSAIAVTRICHRGDGGQRLRGSVQPRRRPGRRCRRAAHQRSPRSPRVGDRLVQHGREGRHAPSPSAWAARSSNWAGNNAVIVLDDADPGPGDAGGAVRRGRALPASAAPHPADDRGVGDQGRCSQAARRRLPAGSHRRSPRPQRP